ncbi:MAG: squalene/phytoene synthase family protein [Bacteroidota bacterium]|nr:squalene/phytoene synthase family protein [Bacteroidota bacterium]
MTANSYRELFIEIFNSIDFNKIIDHPNILIAANFWDEERYCAAKKCYRFMREIDDLIDNHKANRRVIAEEERTGFVANVNEWLRTIPVRDDCNPESDGLMNTIRKFRIPLWPLESFAKSMIYDINNDGFPDLKTFLEYAQGASVAPASIFVHLSGLTAQDGQYIEPAFNVREAASPCAIFSYLVHIIRDFQKDQFNNLNYFADDLIFKNGLTRMDLNNIAKGGPVTPGFRNMIREYYLLAGEYIEKTGDIIKRIRPLMGPRYQLSLEIIFDLYLMVYQRIDIEKGSFTSYELNPTPEETRSRVYETIMKFRI